MAYTPNDLPYLRNELANTQDSGWDRFRTTLAAGLPSPLAAILGIGGTPRGSLHRTIGDLEQASEFDDQAEIRKAAISEARRRMQLGDATQQATIAAQLAKLGEVPGIVEDDKQRLQYEQGVRQHEVSMRPAQDFNADISNQERAIAAGVGSASLSRATGRPIIPRGVQQGASLSQDSADVPYDFQNDIALNAKGGGVVNPGGKPAVTPAITPRAVLAGNEDMAGRAPTDIHPNRDPLGLNALVNIYLPLAGGDRNMATQMALDYRRQIAHSANGTPPENYAKELGNVDETMLDRLTEHHNPRLAIAAANEIARRKPETLPMTVTAERSWLPWGSPKLVTNNAPTSASSEVNTNGAPASATNGKPLTRAVGTQLRAQALADPEVKSGRVPLAEKIKALAAQNGYDAAQPFAD